MDQENRPDVTSRSRVRAEVLHRPGFAPDFSDFFHSSGNVEELIVGGYKSLRDITTLQLRPLTILAGHNTSGKSSIMQPFLLLKQTLEQESSFGPLSLEGAHVHFNRFQQLFWKNGSEVADVMRIGYGYRNAQGLRRCMDAFAVAGNELVVADVSIARGNSEMVLKREQPRPLDSVSMRSVRRKADSSWLESVLWHDELERVSQFREHVAAKDATGDGRMWVGFEGSRAFVSLYLMYGSEARRYPLSSTFCRPFDVLEPWIRSLIHVPGDRGTISRYHRWSPVGARVSSGVFQDHYASVLWDWNKQKSSATGVLEQWMLKMGLGNRVQTRKANDVDVEVFVSRKLQPSDGPSEGEDMVSIADTGLGVSYALPWLVALALAHDQPVYIEEPEAHLHPEAQYRAAEVLAEAARRGARVIVETHSDILLVGIQRMIAEGKIDPKDVSLNWFSRDINGATSVTRAELTASGEFGDWPGDLDSTLMHAQGDFLDASIAREAKDTGDA